MKKTLIEFCKGCSHYKSLEFSSFPHDMICDLTGESDGDCDLIFIAITRKIPRFEKCVKYDKMKIIAELDNL